jgi:hypothetical protein
MRRTPRPSQVGGQPGLRPLTRPRDRPAPPRRDQDTSSALGASRRAARMHYRAEETNLANRLRILLGRWSVKGDPCGLTSSRSGPARYRPKRSRISCSF